MPKKRRSPVRKKHDHVAATTLLLVAIVLGTLAGADFFIPPSESPRIAHANTSANPYQPVQAGSYIPPTPTLPSSFQLVYPTVSEPSNRAIQMSPLALERKLQTLRKHAAKTLKTITRLQDQIDSLQRKLDGLAGKANEELEQQILVKTDALSRLDKRLADLNAQIAKYEILQNPMRDQSR